MRLLTGTLAGLAAPPWPWLPRALYRRLPELMLAAFIAGNAAVIVLAPQWETVSFHLIWVSLALLYGFRVWSPRTTAVALAAVSVLTAATLLPAVLAEARYDELVEIPLMSAVFLAMVWHARRRSHAYAELDRAAVRERDFVGDVAHQLRTPITVAHGHAELIAAAHADAPTAGDAAIVIDEPQRLARICDRLLTIATVGQTASALRGAVNVEVLLAGTMRRWESAAQRQWRSNVACDQLVAMDGERIERALDALIENAIKATDESDVIELSAQLENGSLVLEVRDTGAGIAPEDLPRIFDRFARGKTPRGRTSGGTGLGLAMVKAIAEAHGGSVTAAGDPGRGATFQLRLPRLGA